MERRTFIQGAIGLVVISACAGFGAANTHTETQAQTHVTPEVSFPESAEGPVMQAGIELVPVEEGVVHGMLGTTHLFDVDHTGAELIRLADGTRTLDELADSTNVPVAAADVAAFFVALGQAGYLQNKVLVNLVERTA